MKLMKLTPRNNAWAPPNETKKNGKCSMLFGKILIQNYIK